MTLTAVEKCAGRKFRDAAEASLASTWTDFPDSAPCSAQARFFRHECPEVAGRTRSIRLEDMTYRNPEIWVCWSEEGGGLEALSPAEAQERLASGTVAEYEVVLAGKFLFEFKQGVCGRCGMYAMSREGVLKDARPMPKVEQDDLASYGSWPGGTNSILREAGFQ